ncbi:MAG TPA: exodeoxyribonuclease VII large subunit, partial [Rhodospirillales bacterium]|nr:exodeoxyribonuclease VII large subunit [Rhodospirillales bacterium]
MPLNSDYKDNKPEFTVSELSQALKLAVEEAFSQVRVRGEISRLTLARSGHMYLTLKDENAVLDGVCWRGTVSRLSISPEDGLEVIATGRLSTYSGRSSYQIVIEQMEVAGEGALLKLLEDRRRKLLAEGLFDEGRKQPLPYIPEVIGVVTSPTGAAIRDILNRLRERFPRRVLVWPTNVQGEGAAEQIASAIDGFNKLVSDGELLKPDLIIVARGGGSLEDLWAFNEELVVRATAASKIPIISAVGHETDVTLIDFASDRRASTPTAAAEIAVPVRAELTEKSGNMGARLLPAIQRQLDFFGKEIEGLGRAIPLPLRWVEAEVQRLDDRADRGLVNPKQQLLYNNGKLMATARAWHRSLESVIKQKLNELDKASLILEGASYQRILESGFALVTDQSGKTVSAVDVSSGTKLGIRFFDGDIHVEVKSGIGAKMASKSSLNLKKPSRNVDKDAQG